MPASVSKPRPAMTSISPTSPPSSNVVPLTDRFARPLRIGTRGSKLARTQTEIAVRRLAEIYPDLPPPEVVPIKTTGDQVQDRPLADIGGKGLFAKEIEIAILAGELDFAVHSLKDLETLLPDGLDIAAVLPREDPRDALVSPLADSLSELPGGARIGTTSVRRRAQVLAGRPDCVVAAMRGNINTRLEKLASGEADAVILALAGLKRLDISGQNINPIDVDTMLPSAGQGVVALQCRAEDEDLLEVLGAVNDPDSNLTSAAERALLAALDGSCRTPIGGLAQLVDGDIWLRANVALPDGSRIFRAEGRADPEDGVRLGAELGEQLRAAAPADLFEDLQLPA